jgi:SAM-dependent methyltransferase
MVYGGKWRQRHESHGASVPFYQDHVYPHLVSAFGNPKPIEDIRRGIVPSAQENVFEIGVCPGVNFTHYDPARVSKVYALEPNMGMLRRAEQQRRRTEVKIEFLHLPGERIPFGDASVDTVVSTFTLCTIPGVVEAIESVYRVLKPGGKLIFFEHGLSPDPPVQRWQKRSEPLFRWAFEGCHVTRDIASLIGKGGFNIEQMDAGISLLFQSQGRIAGGAWRFPNDEMDNSRKGGVSFCDSAFC